MKAKKYLILSVVVAAAIMLPHITSTSHAAASGIMAAQGDGIVTRYAVLLNGSPETVYRDDLVFMYNTLTDDYGFLDSNVYVLNYAGNTPAGIVDYPATWATIDSVFTTLSGLVDDDDFFLLWVTDHGNGYRGDPEGQYYGYLGSSGSVDPGDEPDYIESELKIRTFCTAGQYGLPSCNHGMDVFKPYYKRYSSTYYIYYRNTYVSTFSDLYFEQGGLQSDGDVYIERLVDLLEGDTNGDHYIDFDQGEVLDYDEDGNPPYDPATGVYDEDDWGDLDYIDDYGNLNTKVPGAPDDNYIIFDAGLDGHLDIDINPDINNLEVDGTDLDNAGLFDGIDVNDDGDMDDWVSMDESIYLQLSDNVTDDDMALFVDRVNAGTIVVFMGQCYSGGFIEDLSAPGRIIVTSSGEEEPASQGVVNTSLISALHGAQPDGSPVDADYNRDGQISIREAFTYAAVQPNPSTAQYDDNGDGVSHAYPIPDGDDGPLGALTFFEGAGVHHLSLDSTVGGSVTAPGEGAFAYDHDTVVALVATPDAGYEFGFWTGDIDDYESSSTTVTMDKGRRVTAHFVADGAGVLYVDADATGADDGSSWGDAYTGLQDALTAAQPGNEIWVAAGTYTPTATTEPGDLRTASFQLKNGVTIYGGFAGGEASRESRDWSTSVTLLSGDIGVTGDSTDNAYHVFNHPVSLGLDNTAVLDGFTIAGGNADGSGINADGGGMLNLEASPRMANCTFSGNTASDDGGGIYNERSRPLVQSSTFTGNAAGDDGGGMYNYYSAPYVSDSTFSQNTADSGGGMSSGFGSAPTVTGCTFTGNHADADGGAMYNSNADEATLIGSTFTGNTGQYGAGIANNSVSSQIIGCEITNNTSTYKGGGIYTVGDAPRLLNCTISGNSAQYGGGIYHYSRSAMYMVNCTLTGNLASADWGSGMAFDSTGHTRPSNVTVVNSILWNGSDQIYNCDGSTISISYSDVQGGYPGTGNIDADPLFVNAAGGDLHLGEGSPCIDAGNDAAIFAFGDFEGHSRPLDGDDDGTFIADIGADEYDGSPTAVTLADLKATQVEGGILVEWMTTMEIDTVGFNVWRNEARDGSYVRINDTLIPSASPGSVWGGAYSHVDSDVIPDTTYYYKLEELEVGGGRNWYGPVSTEDDNPTSVILLRATAGNTDFAALAWWLAGAAIVGGASWVIAGLAKLLQSNNTSVRTRGK